MFEWTLYHRKNMAACLGFDENKRIDFVYRLPSKINVSKSSKSSSRLSFRFDVHHVEMSVSDMFRMGELGFHRENPDFPFDPFHDESERIFILEDDEGDANDDDKKKDATTNYRDDSYLLAKTHAITHRVHEASVGSIENIVGFRLATDYINGKGTPLRRINFAYRPIEIESQLFSNYFGGTTDTDDDDDDNDTNDKKDDTFIVVV